MRETSRAARNRDVFDKFLSGGKLPRPDMLEPFRRVAATVPAYQEFLHERGIDL